MNSQIFQTFLDFATRLRSLCVSAMRTCLWRRILLALLTSVGLASLASAQVSVTAGVSPSAVSLNPLTNKIYVVNIGSNNITVIDGATNSVITTFAPAAAQFRGTQ